MPPIWRRAFSTQPSWTATLSGVGTGQRACQSSCSAVVCGGCAIELYPGFSLIQRKSRNCANSPLTLLFVLKTIVFNRLTRRLLADPWKSNDEIPTGGAAINAGVGGFQTKTHMVRIFS